MTNGAGSAWSAARKVATFSYDIASRLSATQYDGLSFASDIVYNAASQTTALKVGSNTASQLSESYTYDAQTGLLTNQKVQRAGGSAATLLDLSYDYLRPNTTTGRTGQLTKITNHLDTSGNKNRQFEYDALARLKVAKGGPFASPTWTQTDAYDRYGNRETVVKTGSAPLDAVNQGGNQLSLTLTYHAASDRVASHPASLQNYSHDAAGNVTRGQAPDGAWQQSKYDAANRLAEVYADGAGQAMAKHFYGASNQRLKSEESG